MLFCFNFSENFPEVILETLINSTKELDETLKDWSESCEKLNCGFDFSDDFFYNSNGSVIKWIETVPKNLESWDIIYYNDLIPLYKIFEESLQKEIENLFEDQILMMDSIKIENKERSYYRVRFDTSLKSYNYQIYGTIINKNYEKCINIIIKFKYCDQHGFSIIVERYLSCFFYHL